MKSVFILPRSLAYPCAPCGRGNPARGLIRRVGWSWWASAKTSPYADSMCLCICALIDAATPRIHNIFSRLDIAEVLVIRLWLPILKSSMISSTMWLQLPLSYIYETCIQHPFMILMIEFHDPGNIYQPCHEGHQICSQRLLDNSFGPQYCVQCSYNGHMGPHSSQTLN